MAELFNRHSVKIQIGTLLSILAVVIYWTFVGSGYITKVDANSAAIEQLETKTEKIPVMENNIADIKEDISEIKGDLKQLLKTK